jgi:xanthine/CO dehydrogenase XdhC/CoxF family maturation factor
VGRFFAILARYGPTGPGPAPTSWGDPATVTRLLAPATVTTSRSHVRLAFDGPPAELVAYYRAHFPPLVALAPDEELDAELIDLYSGGYDLEYLTVLAVTPPTGAPRGAPTGRSG